MYWQGSGRLDGYSNKFTKAIEIHQEIYQRLLDNQELIRALAYVNPFDTSKPDITNRKQKETYIKPKTFMYEVIEADYSQLFIQTANGVFGNNTESINRWNIIMVIPNRNEIIQHTAIPRNLYISQLIAETLEVNGISVGQPRIVNYNTARINPAHMKTELIIEMRTITGRKENAIST